MPNYSDTKRKKHKVKSKVIGSSRGVLYLSITTPTESPTGSIGVFASCKHGSLPTCIIESTKTSIVLALPAISGAIEASVAYQDTCYTTSVSSLKMKIANRFTRTSPEKEPTFNFRFDSEHNSKTERLEIEEILPSGDDRIVRCRAYLKKEYPPNLFRIIDGYGAEISARIDCLGTRPAISDDFDHLVEHYLSFTIPNSSAIPYFIQADRLFACIDETCLIAKLDSYERTKGSHANDYVLDSWLKNHARTSNELQCQRTTSFESAPSFSIIVPLFHTPVDLFREMVQSVLNQTYRRFELILVNSTPGDKRLRDAVYGLTQNNKQVSSIELEENLGITENTNRGIQAATGDFLCFLDHDDLLEPDALFEYATALDNDNDIDILYCDEDKLMQNKQHTDARFKPDFDLELLRTNNYICHFLCIRASLVKQLSPPTSVYDGAQDYHMVLRCAERARRIHHVSRILYHWRIVAGSTAESAESKPYADEAGRRSLQEHLDRCNANASAKTTDINFVYRTKYELSSKPSVSIVIPHTGTNQGDITRISLPDSNGIKFDSLISEKNNVSIHQQINATSSDYLLFASSGLFPLNSDSIMELIRYVQRDAVFACGGRILYSDNTVKHAGFEKTPDGLVHLYRGVSNAENGYFFGLRTAQEVYAVSPDCVLISRNAFISLDDQNESLFTKLLTAQAAARRAGKSIIHVPTALFTDRTPTFSVKNGLIEQMRLNTTNSSGKDLPNAFCDDVSEKNLYNVNLSSSSPYYLIDV